MCVSVCVCLTSRAGERLNSFELQDFVHLDLQSLPSFSDLHISHAAFKRGVYSESKLLQILCDKHTQTRFQSFIRRFQKTFN